MKCPHCGETHALLDPVFRRPDHVAAFPFDKRKGNIMESDDVCAIRAQPSTPYDRYFVRCTLAVPLLDHGTDEIQWGVWAEVGEQDARIIRQRWEDADQASEPPMPAVLANNVRGYPATMGLKLRLQLMGPDTRPTLVFEDGQEHPFVTECRSGVSVKRAKEWLAMVDPRNVG
jgi:hypothetical protein